MGTAAIGEADGRAGIVDEQFLAGAMNLAHGPLELPGELPVILAELRVAVGVPVRVVGAVLFPQQHQRHALAPQFLMQPAVIRLHMIARAFAADQQAPLQHGFVSVVHCRPIQTCGSCQPNILGDDAL